MASPARVPKHLQAVFHRMDLPLEVPRIQGIHVYPKRYYSLTLVRVNYESAYRRVCTRVLRYAPTCVACMRRRQDTRVEKKKEREDVGEAGEREKMALCG